MIKKSNGSELEIPYDEREGKGGVGIREDVGGKKPFLACFYGEMMILEQN